MTAPSRDEFAAWRDHPVTRFVMAGVSVAAEAQRNTWMEASWSHGALSEITRERLMTRADAYLGFTTLTVEDAYALNGLEPPPKEPANG